MRPLTESVFPKPEQAELKGFLALTTPAYLGLIICRIVLEWSTLLDLDGAPVSLPLTAALLTNTYPVTVLSVVGASWFGFLRSGLTSHGWHLCSDAARIFYRSNTGFVIFRHIRPEPL